MIEVILVIYFNSNPALWRHCTRDCFPDSVHSDFGAL